MNIVKKLRQLNRQRNYFKKQLKYQFSLYMAAKIWRYNSTSAPSPYGVKTILLIRTDGKIGDAVVSTYPLRALYKAGYTVDILAVRANEPVFRHNPFIRNLYVAEDAPAQSMLDQFNHGVPATILTALRANKYDLMVDTAVWRTEVFMPKLIHDIRPRISLGFNKQRWLKQYNKSVDFDFLCQHIRNVYILLADWLNIPDSKSFRYEVFYPQSVMNDVVKSIGCSDGRKRVVINIYASHDDRSLSGEQLAGLVKGINAARNDLNLIIMDYKQQLDIRKYKGAKIYYPLSLFHTMALLSLASLVISPDTAVVHISAAYDIPLVAVYKYRVKNNNLWSPGYSKGHQLFSETLSISQDETLIDKILTKVNNII